MEISFLTFLEFVKPRTKVLIWILGEGPIPGLQTAAFLLCPHLADSRERSELSGASSCKSPDSTHLI